MCHTYDQKQEGEIPTNNPQIPLAAFVTPQKVLWCPDCAKHHNGVCADVDAPRDNAPTVNVNIRKDDDDDGSVSVVTDGSNVTMAKKPRVTAFGISDTVCTRADGTTYTIPKRKDRRDAKRTAARIVKEVKTTEAIERGMAISLDERRRLNGLA